MPSNDLKITCCTCRSDPKRRTRKASRRTSPSLLSTSSYISSSFILFSINLCKKQIVRIIVKWWWKSCEMARERREVRGETQRTSGAAPPKNTSNTPNDHNKITTTQQGYHKSTNRASVHLELFWDCLRLRIGSAARSDLGEVCSMVFLRPKS